MPKMSCLTDSQSPIAPPARPYLVIPAQEVKDGDFIARNCAGDAEVLEADISPHQVILHLLEEDGEETDSSYRPDESIKIRPRERA